MMVWAKVKVVAVMVGVVIVGSGLVVAQVVSSNAAGGRPPVAATMASVADGKAAGPETPTPAGLVAAYEHALASISRVGFRAEARSEWVLPGRRFSQLTRIQHWRDGDRADTDSTVFDLKDGKPSGTPAPGVRSITLGATAYRYQRGEYLVISEKPNSLFATQNRFALDAGVFFFGYGYDGGQSLPQVLRSARSLTVRSEMEKIDGADTYVLEAVGAYGTHTLWLDPRLGFQPRRILNTKGPGDRIWDKPLAHRAGEADTQQDPWTKAPLTTYSVCVDITEFQWCGDVAVPKSAKIREQSEYTDHTEATGIIQYVCSGIELNPDFAKVGAFVVDAPNGTPVYYQDDARETTGVQFKWQAGRVIPRVSDDELVDLEHAIAQVGSGGIAATQPSGTVALPASQAIDGPSSGGRWLLGATAVVGLIAFLLTMMLRKQKRRSGS